MRTRGWRIQMPLRRADIDQSLVERSLAGDLRAFEALVERHRGVVYRVASRIVGADAAEDVSQDAFLRAYHRLDRFRGEASFRTWLLQITTNAALTHLSRRRDESTDDHAVADEAVDRDASRQPVTELERRERQARLELKLRGLRPDYRSLLVLRDLEQLSYEEIAQTLDMPLGSVKGRLHRARGELIDILRNNTYDWELPA
ncbi:MAG: sigma-70 family RNA polymerase sigma factor [Solirubrobacterales bacterium]|nr:sigma-70 family RNA polymerase sigma factor [Solirubrobacterales bacterium]